MGINLNAGVSYLFTRRHSYREFEGKSCLMLGVQTIDSNGYDLFTVARRLRFELPPYVYNMTRREMADNFDSYRLFKWIGFSDVKALDYSDYEGAEILSDLNEPIDEELNGKFDLVYDGGTLEHVYNVPQAMKNMGDMLKVGGYIIHDVPAENCNNHGFYMFSPTLFQDYYLTNKYLIEELYMFNHREGDKSSEYRSIDCRISDPRPFYAKNLKLNSEVSYLVCVVQKQKESSDGVVPIQGFYTDAYDDNKKLSKTIELIKDVYNNVAIYGTGSNARSLYDLLYLHNDRVCLIRGENSENTSSRYSIREFEDVLEWADCIVIGSFVYADIIEDRIRNDCNERNIKIVNMLDV